MKETLRFAVVLAACLIPMCAQAAAPERKVLIVEGSEGLWFRQDVADRLLADFKDARALRDGYAERVSLLEKKLEIRAEELALQRRMSELAEQGERRATQALDAAIKAKVAAEADRDAWHRSRGFWFGAGVLATAIAVVGAAVAVR